MRNWQGNLCRPRGLTSFARFSKRPLCKPFECMSPVEAWVLPANWGLCHSVTVQASGGICIAWHMQPCSKSHMPEQAQLCNLEYHTHGRPWPGRSWPRAHLPARCVKPCMIRLSAKLVQCCLSDVANGVAGLQDLLPGIINQLGPDSLNNLKKLAEQVRPSAPVCSVTEASITQLCKARRLTISASTFRPDALFFSVQDDLGCSSISRCVWVSMCAVQSQIRFE